MKYRLVTLIGFVIAVTAIAVTSSRITFRYPPAVHETLVPRASSYLGVFEPGSPPPYSRIESFADMAGQEPNLAGYYSGWAEPFKMAFATDLHRHGLIPYVQIDPSFASVAAIADGSQDTYLKSYADSVRDFGHAVVIGFGHEMNGNWYSWGYPNTSPGTFIAAWRHIVTVFRDEGADNVTWLWTVNQQERPGSKAIRPWWPGTDYVTWVGIDGYYARPSDSFSTVFLPTVQQVRHITGKPILLSETAVHPSSRQFGQIEDLFNSVQTNNMLGLVWFDEDQQPPDGPYHQDWHIKANSQAQVAFRFGLSQLTIAHT